jgi:PhzF family phenazine biosynthesis protein
MRYLQLDVFSRRAGGGNPLGVVFGADAWTDAAMQRFAAWTGLVETTFVLAPRDPAASYRLRIFTPSREIAFAGHPTVGSAHAVIETGFAAARDGRLLQECGAGVLPVRIEGEGAARQLAVEAPRARVLRDGLRAHELLPAALGGVALGALPPAFVEGGRRWWVAELADEPTLRAWRPDHAAIGALARASDSLGVCAFARSSDPAFELVVRAFPAGVGILEDPASGAANGLVGTYIAAREPDGALARGYRVSQGREIGHDASLTVRVEGDGGVWVGGQTHTVIDGTLRWPAPSG